MKLLKMHDNADGKFDQFVKEQLDKTDVDMALADTYFVQMVLPPAQVQHKKKRWGLLLLLLASCFTALLVYQFSGNTKQSRHKATGNNHTITIQQSTDDATPMTNPINAKDSNNKAHKSNTPTLAPTPGNQVPNTVVMPSGNLPTTTTKDKKTDQPSGTVANFVSALAKDTSHAIAMPPLPSNQVAVPIVSKRKDTLASKAMPPKAKDSVYIIW
jgi:hypothetical protein